MTLMEFTIAAKTIIDDAGLGPCTVTCASDMRIDADGLIEYQHKCTAHPKGGMLTSWHEPNPFSCNNPTLALERFQIAVDRRLAPPSEPEAITDIELSTEESEVDTATNTADNPMDAMVSRLWDYCLELTDGQLIDMEVRKDFTSVEGSRRLAVFSLVDEDMKIFSIVHDLDGFSLSSMFQFADICKRVGLDLESEVENG